LNDLLLIIFPEIIKSGADESLIQEIFLLWEGLGKT